LGGCLRTPFGSGTAVSYDGGANPAVPALPGPHLDGDGVLDLAADQHRRPRRKPLDLLFELGAHPLDPLAEGAEVVGVCDPEDDLGVALGYDVFVHPRRPLADDEEAEAELPPLSSYGPDDGGAGGPAAA